METETRTSLRPGDPARIGEYEVLARLGSGGMGVVYLARDPGGRRVAVKVVHAHLADGDEFRGRFRSEVRRARQVPSFCTAAVLDADPEAPQPWLVVEFVEGPSLAEEVRRGGPLPPSQLYAVAVGVATALAAIHGAGVVHRDLKPQNVLLAPGSPKVIDFGIARALESATQHTRTGEIVGTVSYMAPERFDEPSTPLTPAADVFAWACVVTYAATGRAPFDAETPMATFARILTKPPELGSLDGPLRTLVERALAADPAARPTARELLDQLLGAEPAPPVAAALDRQPELRTAAREVQAPPAAKPRRGGLIALVAALGLTLTAGIGVVAVRTVDPLFSLLDAAAASDESGTTTDTVALDVPPGDPLISDPLTTAGSWSAATASAGSCVNTGVALEVTRATPGTVLCSGPKTPLTNQYTLQVTGTIQLPGTCLAVWLSWTPAGGHRLLACEGSFTLSRERAGHASEVLRVFPLGWDELPAGEPVRLQAVVRGNGITVGHDDIQIGQSPLAGLDVTSGRPAVGLVTVQGGDTPQGAASFTDLTVEALPG
ncbi:serine/threonine-protein kinase [Actinoplanes sp. RD1]|uniref:serine/threonine-protein kinase n=1 Tax=Actinoplanes sp. RD1 TaxID=3064538 RepID=UPI0027428F36|nr:serine/threonine-protein kinase [Actinoplanes sp. RD1]